MRHRYVALLVLAGVILQIKPVHAGAPSELIKLAEKEGPGVWRATEREWPEIERGVSKYGPKIFHTIAAEMGRFGKWILHEDNAVADTLRVLHGKGGLLHHLPAADYIRGLEEHARVSRAIGNNELAVRDYDELSLYFKSLHTPEGDVAAEKYAQIDDLLHGEINGTVGRHASNYSSDGLSGVVHALPHDDAKILHDLQTTKRRILRIAVTQSDVREFVRDFGEGAKDPMRTLMSRNEFDGQLIANWLSTPQEKRVFFIGSGGDFALMQSCAQQLEQDGYRSFFYKMCKDANGQLCESKVVGAMFATSGKAIVIDTPSAQQSRYVLHEANTAYLLLKGERMALLLTPADLVKAGGVLVSGPLTVAEISASATPTQEFGAHEKAHYYLYRMKRAISVVIALFILALIYWIRKREKGASVSRRTEEHCANPDPS